MGPLAELFDALFGTAINRLLPPKVRRVLNVLGALICIGLLVFLVFFTPVFDLIAQNFR